jgi:hypothetical protein
LTRFLHANRYPLRLKTLRHGICILLSKEEMQMIPRRYSHFVYAVIQSGLTCLIAAGIASYPSLAAGAFLRNWALSWLISWAMMLPVVLLAAPLIRAAALRLTRDEQTG